MSPLLVRLKTKRTPRTDARLALLNRIVLLPLGVEVAVVGSVDPEHCSEEIGIGAALDQAIELRELRNAGPFAWPRTDIPGLVFRGDPEDARCGRARRLSGSSREGSK